MLTLHNKGGKGLNLFLKGVGFGVSHNLFRSIVIMSVFSQPAMTLPQHLDPKPLRHLL